MLKDVHDLLTTQRGITYLLAVVLGAFLFWWFVHPRLVEERLTTINEEKEQLERANDQLDARLKEYVTAYNELREKYGQMSAEMTTRELSTVIFQNYDETKQVMNGIDVKVSQAPDNDYVESFNVILRSHEFLGSKAVKISSDDPYEFEHQGKIYYFVVKMLGDYESNRAKLSVFSGAASNMRQQ